MLHGETYVFRGKRGSRHGNTADTHDLQAAHAIQKSAGMYKRVTFELIKFRPRLLLVPCNPGRAAYQEAKDCTEPWQRCAAAGIRIETCCYKSEAIHEIPCCLCNSATAIQGNQQVLLCCPQLDDLVNTQVAHLLQQP